MSQSMQRLFVTLLAVVAFAYVGHSWAAAVGTGQAPGLERPCIPKSGAATEVACTTSTSASQELTPGTSWEITCDSDAYVRAGVGSATAVAGDFKYRAEQLYYMSAGGPEGINWFACKSLSANGSCWMRECR